MKPWVCAGIVLVVICVVMFPSASAGFLITEVCPDGYAKGDGDEYFLLSGAGSLDGWVVTDGEGSVRFPVGSSSGGRVLVARDGAAYYEVHGIYPDYEISSASQEVPDALFTGRFQMANTGDELTLLSHDRQVQVVSWPGDFSAGTGRIHMLTDGVWDERILKIGQSRFAAETFTADAVTVFVSPDSSFESVRTVILGTTSTLLISMYEFTHPEIARVVADAAQRGVKTTLLVEGGPVGGISSEEKGVLNYLANAGVLVCTMESTDALPARYRYLHTKYLISDDTTTVVLSENFKPTGVPLPGTRGNRGWGAAVVSADVAGYFREVFVSDLRGYDVHPYLPGSEPLPVSWSDEEITVHFPARTFYQVSVTPVISPDTSHLIPALIMGTTERIDVQQAYITNYPGSAHNVWLEQVLDLGGRGREVRVLLDGMYYNVDGEADNDEMVAYINRISDNTGISAESRLMNPTGSITKLHNKGVIVDLKYVLISSINWNYNSPNHNREAGIIIDNRGAAQYFSDVFTFDWEGKSDEFPIQAFTPVDLRYLAVVGILLALAVIWVLRRKK